MDSGECDKEVRRKENSIARNTTTRLTNTWKGFAVVQNNNYTSGTWTRNAMLREIVNNRNVGIETDVQDTLDTTQNKYNSIRSAQN